MCHLTKLFKNHLTLYKHIKWFLCCNLPSNVIDSFSPQWHRLITSQWNVQLTRLISIVQGIKKLYFTSEGFDLKNRLINSHWNVYLIRLTLIAKRKQKYVASQKQTKNHLTLYKYIRWFLCCNILSNVIDLFTPHYLRLIISHWNNQLKKIAFFVQVTFYRGYVRPFEIHCKHKRWFLCCYLLSTVGNKWNCY